MKAIAYLEGVAHIPRRLLGAVEPKNAKSLRLNAEDVRPELPFRVDMLLELTDALILEGATYIAEYEGLLRIGQLEELPDGGLLITAAFQPGHQEALSVEEKKSLKVIGRALACQWLIP